MDDNTAVIYARVSSTGERQSTERQVKDLSDYALYRQMDVRKVFSTKSADQKKEEYKEAISLLRKGYAIRDVAKLTGKGISTIQRVKKEFC